MRVALIFLSPEMLVRGRPNELRGDANLASGAKDRAFHNTVHPEFAGDFGDRPVHAAIPQDGCSGDDVKGTDFGEIGDEFVGHAIGEKLFLGVVGKIFEWKDGERADGRRRGSAA